MSAITRQTGRKRSLGPEEERRLYAEFLQLARKDSVKDLAQRYGVARATVYVIVRRVEEETRPVVAPEPS